MVEKLPLSEPVSLTVVDLQSNREKVVWDIALVGVGGTGGYILQSLMRVLKNFDIRGLLTIADGDEVEEKNLLRQNFIECDIAKKKVEVLSRRYSNVYDMDMRTVGTYVEDLEAVENLFVLGRSDWNYWPGRNVQRVLIGAVDNNRTRQLFHGYFCSCNDLIYIDAGNDGVLPISEDVSEEDALESGYSGQVVVGVKAKGRVILPPVGWVYPNILEQSEVDFFPSQACGQTVVNHPQRMQTNLMAANVVLGYLNTLLSEGKLISHYTNFNARNQVMRPEYITQELLENYKNSSRVAV